MTRGDLEMLRRLGIRQGELATPAELKLARLVDELSDRVEALEQAKPAGRLRRLLNVGRSNG